jgi:hypothetical protein
VLAILQMQVAWRYDYDHSELAVAAAAQFRAARSKRRETCLIRPIICGAGRGWRCVVMLPAEYRECAEKKTYRNI